MRQLTLTCVSRQAALCRLRLADARFDQHHHRIAGALEQHSKTSPQVALCALLISMPFQPNAREKLPCALSASPAFRRRQCGKGRMWPYCGRVTSISQNPCVWAQEHAASMVQ